MPSRYNNRAKVDVSKEEMFRQIKERRDLNMITLYGTARFNSLTDLQLQSLGYETYTWSRGDRFYKIAADYYGDPSYWWVVALFNNTPTEKQIAIGQEIYVPLEPESLASMMGVI